MSSIVYNLPWPEIWKYIGGAWVVLGPVIGWFANDWFSTKRDRNHRLLNLIGCLARLRSEIEREPPSPIKYFWQAYVSRVHEFRDLASRVDRDRVQDVKFRELSDAVGGVRYEDVMYAEVGDDNREIVCTHIDALLKYLQDL